MSGILWRRSSTIRRCFECTEPILPGESYARHTEFFVTLNWTDGVSLGSERRTYCQTCAELLADSLSTTEEVA